MSVLRKLRGLFRKEQLDAEMSDEIRLHLELQEKENRAKGMAPEEARYAALRSFGGVEQVKEIAREQSGWIWLEQFFRDFRLSLRSLAKVPMFTLTVITVLALCIGANASVASALYSMILKPLPFRGSKQLIQVFNEFPKLATSNTGASLAQYLDYKENADLFEGFALNTLWTFTIGEETEAMRFVGAQVSTDYFDLWAVAPYRGGFFRSEHANPGTHVVVFTQSFWENYFHSDPDLVGKSIRISGEQWTVLGIAPRSVESIDGSTVAFIPTPVPQQALPPQARTALGYSMYARLKPGVPRDQGVAQLQTLEERYLTSVAPPAVRSYIQQSGHRMSAGDIRGEQAKRYKTALWVLQVGVLAVFLLGTANAANLLLARFNAREGEMRIRRALGANRLTLARGILIEGFLLTAVGSCCGLGGGWAAVRVINRHLASGDGYEKVTVSMDPSIVGFSLLCALGVAFIISMIPLLEVWRSAAFSGSTTSQVPDASRSATGNRRIRKLSGLLVTAQVALAFILLVSAGLVVRSFSNLLAVDLGFRPESIIFGRMLVPPGYAAPDKAAALHDRLLDRVRAIPGVDSAALISNDLMISASNPSRSFALRDDASSEAGSTRLANFWAVSPDFFATMGIPLLEGRTFTNADRSATVVPMIIDRKLAERYFPGRSAIGENIGIAAPAPGRSWPVVVGVVENARLNGGDEQTQVPGIYTPLVRGPLTLVLRSSRPVSDVLKAVRAEIRATEPALPFYWAGTLAERYWYHLRYRRGTVALLGTFSGIALLLSAIGLYGMLAYDVSLRTREIGIRGAIGASRKQIIGLIVRQGFQKTAIGMLVGLAGAFAVTRFMRSVLFGVEPADPASIVIVSVLLVAVALLASYLPALRAARINPVLALKCE